MRVADFANRIGGRIRRSGMGWRARIVGPNQVFDVITASYRTPTTEPAHLLWKSRGWGLDPAQDAGELADILTSFLVGDSEELADGVLLRFRSAFPTVDDRGPLLVGYIWHNPAERERLRLFWRAKEMEAIARGDLR